MLTPRMRQVYDAVARYQRQHGYAPTYAEIMAACGLASKGSAHQLVGKLVERGYLRRLPHKARGIKIAPNRPPGPDSIAIPATRCPDCGDQIVGVDCPRDHARAA